MSQQTNLDHQVLSRCKDALEYVENDLDPDEDDDESATDLWLKIVNVFKSAHFTALYNLAYKFRHLCGVRPESYPLLDF